MMAFAIDLSIRLVAAAFIVGGVLRLLRIQAPALRHSAWTLVLAAMLLMPILPSIVPPLPLPVPPAAAPAVAVPLYEPALAPRDTPATIAAPTVGRVVSLPPANPPAAPARDWRPIALLALYFAGVAALLGRLLYGWGRVTAMIRRARPIGQRLYESADVAVPMTAGVFRPVVVVPLAWRSWPDEKRDAVLAHEHAHVARRDPLVAFVAAVNRTLFWFHPLAWWLERKLAITAEHACDEAAAVVVREPRRYAEILLEMAEAVRVHRGRVAWQAVGVLGPGLLEGRIERVLRGAGGAPVSNRQRLSVVTACVAAVLLVVACRQQTAPPLQPDPELSKQLAEEDARMKKFEGVKALTPEDVDALEQRVAANPQDFDTREKLVWYYTTQQGPWEKKLAGIRRHALWLIEHAPEHEVSPPRISRQYDPEGFETARKLWEAHLAKPDASPFIVYRAASFFSAQDKPYAEQLILRGLQMDPESAALKARMRPNVGGYQWRSQLAALYASALIGSESVWGTYNDLRSRPEWLNSAFSQEVRQKVDASTDARLLASIGSHLTRRDHPEDIKKLGIGYLNRALELDPQNVSAKTIRYRATASEKMNEADRLANRAHERFMVSEDITEYAKKNPETAKKERDEAKHLAHQALDLAKAHAGDPEYSAAVMTAHQVLAALALRDGDREQAIEHLHESVKVPVSEKIQYTPPFAWARPVNRLLKEGERQPIVEFLEALAQLTVTERERLLNDAKAIREGRMPVSYQHMMNREWNEKNRPDARKTVSGTP